MEGFFKGLKVVKKVIGVRVGNGSSVCLWDDIWIGDTLLQSLVREINSWDEDLRVVSIIVGDKKWDLSSFIRHCPCDCEFAPLPHSYLLSGCDRQLFF